MGTGDAGVHCNQNSPNRNRRKAREMLDESTAETLAEYPPASMTGLEQWTHALCHPPNLTKARAVVHAVTA